MKNELEMRPLKKERKRKKETKVKEKDSFHFA